MILPELERDRNCYLLGQVFCHMRTSLAAAIFGLLADDKDLLLSVKLSSSANDFGFYAQGG